MLSGTIDEAQKERCIPVPYHGPLERLDPKAGVATHIHGCRSPDGRSGLLYRQETVLRSVADRIQLAFHEGMPPVFVHLKPRPGGPELYQLSGS